MKVDGKEVIDMLGRLQQELPERYSQALEKACLKVEEDGKKNQKAEDYPYNSFFHSSTS